MLTPSSTRPQFFGALGRFGLHAGIRFGLILGAVATLMGGWQLGLLFGLLGGAFFGVGVSFTVYLLSLRRARQ